jgi:hypothetical protein
MTIPGKDSNGNFHGDSGQFVSLRDYIERIFDERQKALDIAFKASEQALALASRSLEQRLERLNELRAEVTEDRAEYVKRDVYETRIGQLEKFQSRLIGVGAILVIIVPILTALIVKGLLT